MSKTIGAAAGLSASAAAKLLAEKGPNELVREAGPGPLRLLAHQFASPLVGLLAAACVIAIVLGEVVDAIAIASIVVINGVVGFVQEYRAGKAVEALRSLTAPRARVERDGIAIVVPAREVVVGDLLLLEAGDIVAADARVVTAHALRTGEAMLTGESLPIDKAPEPVADGAALADRTDHVFGGTLVANGAGTAVVVAAGMDTELGHIAHLLAATEDEDTPLQRQLDGVSKTLLVACVGIVALVAGVGLYHGEAWLDVLMRAVALAVAAVPEGLPAVVTLALALGVRRMAARHVLVRRLPAVETLGSATVICTDKTGTLTTGNMVVREVWGEDQQALLYAGAACNDADITGASGDPTELALLNAAHEKGIERPTIESENPRRKVLPFDAERKRMSIEREDGKLYVKGALELLLPICGKVPPGTTEAAERMAAEGLRVLGIALGAGSVEERLDLLGLVGVWDPPRPEAIAAVAAARAAGVRTVMITGDHPVTALAIARAIGIVLEGDGAEDRVHARVTPAEKLAIVKQLKARGEVVAMTGDGVNDAPALREAHIGVAMGRTGAEVTREAADLVLTDDNFASIVEAIREGRAIHDNIRKTVVYLLTGNSGELLLMLAAAVAGFPAPLLPLHLLWINLVTDGMPALALVTDPPGPDVLQRPPRPPGNRLLDRAAWTHVVVVGTVEASVVFAAFVLAIPVWGIDAARSLAFSTLVFSEIFRAFAARDPKRTLVEVGVFTNSRLLLVVLASCAAQGVILEVPAARSLFHLGALTPTGVALAAGLGLIPVTLLELTKLVKRAWAKFRPAAVT